MSVSLSLSRIPPALLVRVFTTSLPACVPLVGRGTMISTGDEQVPIGAESIACATLSSVARLVAATADRAASRREGVSTSIVASVTGVHHRNRRSLAPGHSET